MEHDNNTFEKDSSTQLTTPTLLYIEDDEANRQLVSFILAQRDDLLLLEAENGTNGLHLAFEQRPSMILLDLTLPDIDGFSVLKKLQADRRTQHIPVVAISGNCTPTDIDDGLKAGFHGFLAKPIALEEFKHCLDKHLKDISPS